MTRKEELFPNPLKSILFPTLLRNIELWDEESDPAPQMSESFSLSEDESHVHVELHMPGLNPEDIEVTFNKGVLWVKGEHSEKEESTSRKYYQKAQRQYSYRLAIPGPINESHQPEAQYKQGVLSVSFEKQKKEAPKKISVTVS